MALGAWDRSFVGSTVSGRAVWRFAGLNLASTSRERGDQVRTRVDRGIARGLVAAALAGAMSVGAALGGVAFADDVALSAQAKLPSRFDLRETGVVTPVKSQDPFGTCWAFGGIAAAESSLLSDAGTTFAKTPLDLSERHLAWYAVHPITEAENPSQAGEGLHIEVGEDDSETDLTYNYGGYPIFVTTLFSSGAGPVTEEAFPYRGNAGILESDYYLERKDKLVEKLLESLRDQNPDEDASTLEELAESEAKAYIEDTQKYDYYAREDDWTIPALDKDGYSNRDVFCGYTLRDGNVLPDYAIRGKKSDDEPLGEWLGVNEDSVRAMKQEMLNGRAVSITYCADVSLPGEAENGEYLNLDTWSQYTFDDDDPNHTVCAVGWDDDFPASNFTHTVYEMDEDGNTHADPERSALTTPPGNGAWIVKNSWGSETDAIKGGYTAADGSKHDANKFTWGAKSAAGEATGYFYLSYYDKSLCFPETMDFDDDLDQAGTFYAMQYDYLPAELDFWELRSYDNIATANVFTSEATGRLSSVSTRTFEENTRVTFEVVRLGKGATNPEDGKVVTTFSKNFPYAGFHRVTLTQPIGLKKGERFSIVVRQSTVDGDGRPVFGVDAASAITRESLQANDEDDSAYGVAVVNPGESYLELGKNWVDWADYQKTDEFKKSAVVEYGDEVYETCVDNFAIKAYLVPGK